jgi:putative SOS response-associated peptidase YedK
MCGRFAQSKLVADLVEEFGINGATPESPLPANWNIAPTREIYMVRKSSAQINLATASWGLIGHWYKDEAIARKSQSHAINARSESVFRKPTFRDSFLRKRCLIPADGYYEWATELGKFPPKQPLYISREDGKSLSMAGIGSTWVSLTGKTIESVAIITRASAGILDPINNRMPVILPKDRWESWLDPSLQEAAELRELMEFFRPDAGLTVHAVSHSVNSVANNGIAMIRQVTLGEPETLF